MQDPPRSSGLLQTNQRYADRSSHTGTALPTKRCRLFTRQRCRIAQRIHASAKEEALRTRYATCESLGKWL